MQPEPILSMQSITKRYPGVTALDSVSVDFIQGEVHALLGENGAGKSTLIKIITGAETPDSGTILLEGVPHHSFAPIEAKQKGIEAIYQEFNLIDSLSVAENICFGMSQGKLVDFKAMRQTAKAVFDRMNVDSIPLNAKVESLPSSQKQLVEIAKAISRNAKILIMDEPSAPLSVAEVDRMFDIVRTLKAQGVTIIYISHRLEELFAISDRVTVLRDGQYIATKATADTNRQELISLMVGRELSTTYPQKNCEATDVVLEVEGLSGSGDHDISFTLRKGEILGIQGLMGAGRTELARMLFGADHPDSGTIRINGQEHRFHIPAQAIAAGIGLIPEDRKEQGCFLEKPILWNCTIANIRKLLKGIIIDRKREKEQAVEYANRLDIKTPSLQQLVKYLSGGNQQKIVLAKTLATDSQIIIFDEPTRGIDVGAKQEIYRLMCELAEQGKAILMISSEMPELIGMSDRIIVLANGKIAGELQKDEFDQHRLLELSSGAA